MTLRVQDIQDLELNSRKFSRRNALSLVMGVYDPLGLASAALIQGKILLRKLYTGDTRTRWDTDIVTAEKDWCNWLRELSDPVEISFPRSTQPTGAVGLPRLVGFCDAAEEDVCALLYVVWPVKNGQPTSHLLLAKCRISPLLGATIPRGELQSLVIIHRLALVVVESFPSKFASVSMFTDSMCSLGSLSKTGGLLRPFFSNRVSKIKRIREQLQELVNELPPVHHIPGSSNPADRGTRGHALLRDLGSGSLWQEGPDFLRQPYTEWPTTSPADLAAASMPME